MKIEHLEKQLSRIQLKAALALIPAMIALFAAIPVGTYLDIKHQHDLYVYLYLSGVFVIVALLVVFGLRRTFLKYAPKCPNCAISIYQNALDDIKRDGLCPACGYKFDEHDS